MAPVKKPVGATKLQVARHNAKQVSPELDAEIKEIGLSLGMTVETLQPNPETSTALLQAIVRI